MQDAQLENGLIKIKPTHMLTSFRWNVPCDLLRNKQVTYYVGIRYQQTSKGMVLFFDDMPGSTVLNITDPLKFYQNAEQAALEYEKDSKAESGKNTVSAS